MCAEGCFLDIVWMHEDLMVSRAHVELSEVSRPAEFVQQLFYHWDWEFIFDSHCVEVAKVDAETP